jgi:hypothetical protein
LIREDFDLASLFLQYRSVIWSEEENDFVPIDVWLNANAYDGEGLTIRDTEGVVTPISVENNGEGFIDIYLPRAVGLVKVNFKAGVRSMTTFMGVPCAGASDSFFGESACSPNIQTYYGAITYPTGTIYETFTGSLNSGVFHAPGDGQPGHSGYDLECMGPNSEWQIQNGDYVYGPIYAPLTTRCNAAGAYAGHPVWSAIISATPFP